MNGFITCFEYAVTHMFALLLRNSISPSIKKIIWSKIEDIKILVEVKEFDLKHLPGFKV